jgi:hypothetical protein
VLGIYLEEERQTERAEKQEIDRIGAITSETGEDDKANCEKPIKDIYIARTSKPHYEVQSLTLDHWDSNSRLIFTSSSFRHIIYYL